LQLLLDGRNSSVNDVMNNVLGAYLGLRLANAYPALVATKWNALERIARARPLLALWLATMALQTLLALAPFDFTLKTKAFSYQWLRWHYSWQELRDLPKSSLLAGNGLQGISHHARLRLTLLGTAAIAGWLGALAIVCWRRYWRHSSRIFWQLATATLCFYPFLTILQFSVHSVHPSLLFLLAGEMGVATGMLLTGFIRI
jgi:hypothetical protein